MECGPLISSGSGAEVKMSKISLNGIKEGHSWTHVRAVVIFQLANLTDTLTPYHVTLSDVDINNSSIEHLMAVSNSRV